MMARDEEIVRLKERVEQAECALRESNQRSGKAYRFVGLNTDISEIKRAAGAYGNGGRSLHSTRRCVFQTLVRMR